MAAPFGRCACKHFSNVKAHFLPRRFTSSSACWAQTQTKVAYSNVNSADKIQIPNRKKRDDLAVLKALSSTIKKDFNAPHHMYVDDPFLIPTSLVEKRAYALAKASGKKAARYIVETYPKYFQDDRAEPRIPAFNPEAGLALPDDTEAGLWERIDARLVTEAYQSYQKILQEGNEVSMETLNELLDLLCAYNSSDVPEELQLEENVYFTDDSQNRTKRFTATWKESGLAEMLFDALPEKNARAINSLIRGRAKYLQVKKAYELYTDAVKREVPLFRETFNAIIRAAGFLVSDTEACWEHILEILCEMQNRQMDPDIHTFNEVLFMLSRNMRHPQTVKRAMGVFIEMKNMGIEPTFTSWTYLIRLTYAYDDIDSPLLSQILDELEGKEFKEVQDANDLEFFVAAMSKCFFNLKDMEVAYRIDKLLNQGDNYRFLGDAFKEGLYYTSYFRMLCMFEQIDKIMSEYDRISPHAYTPTFPAMEDLLRAIELNDGYEYIPQIWTDLVLFEYTRKVEFVEQILACMAKKKHDAQLQERFMAIGDSVKQKVEEDALSRSLIRPLELTGSMIGNIITINLNGDNFQRAWEVLYFYHTNKFKISRHPSEESLVTFAELCLEKKDIEKLMVCLSALSDSASPRIDELVEKAKQSLDLDESQKLRMDDLL